MTQNWVEQCLLRGAGPVHRISSAEQPAASYRHRTVRWWYWLQLISPCHQMAPVYLADYLTVVLARRWLDCATEVWPPQWPRRGILPLVVSWQLTERKLHLITIFALLCWTPYHHLWCFKKKCPGHLVVSFHLISLLFLHIFLQNPCFISGVGEEIYPLHLVSVINYVRFFR